MFILGGLSLVWLLIGLISKTFNCISIIHVSSAFSQYGPRMIKPVLAARLLTSNDNFHTVIRDGKRQFNYTNIRLVCGLNVSDPLVSAITWNYLGVSLNKTRGSK